MHNGDDPELDTVFINKDGKTYIKMGGYYSTTEDEDGSDINRTYYNGLEYIDSGEVEINGKAYKCDNFKNPEQNNITKLVMNDDELFAICSETDLSDYSTDGSDSDVSVDLSGNISSTLIVEDFKTSLDDSEFEITGE